MLQSGRDAAQLHTRVRGCVHDPGRRVTTGQDSLHSWWSFLPPALSPAAAPRCWWCWGGSALTQGIYIAPSSAAWDLRGSPDVWVISQVLQGSEGLEGAKRGRLQVWTPGSHHGWGI